MRKETRDIEALYDEWAGDIHFTDCWEELAEIRNDPEQIRERFYKDLDFGTAGIRGVMGAGTNRMNVHVVRRLSWALARHVQQKGEEAMKRGIVVGYDSRNHSAEYAREAAAIFAGYGIRTYIHGEVTPVPLLSFSVRNLHAEAGVMITASHNPKEYNGYKVYGPDGAQLSLEDSASVSDMIRTMQDYKKAPHFNFDYLVSTRKITFVRPQVREAYLRTVRKLVHETHADSGLKVVYTPLHGAGAAFVPEILKRIGIEQTYTVEEQMKPDGDFPTVRVPNPEDPGAYTLALQLAKRQDADLILATDPDSDRTGAYAKNEHGEYEMLNGNQIGVLLLTRRLSGALPPKPFAVSTVVSTRLTEKICAAHNVTYVDVLTGFKFIGEQIAEREEHGDETFVFGFEESYGYLAGSYARDKDAVASCMLLADAAAYYKRRGMTLFDALREIYAQYGAQAEVQVSVWLDGESGLHMMHRLMQALRDRKGRILPEPPAVYRDILESRAYTFNADGTVRDEQPLTLPKSDVLYYAYPDFWFCLRPSGTEPKIKIYFGASGQDRHGARAHAEAVRDRVMDSIRAIRDSL